jgi:hypothetical protein
MNVFASDASAYFGRAIDNRRPVKASLRDEEKEKTCPLSRNRSLKRLECKRGIALDNLLTF